MVCPLRYVLVTVSALVALAFALRDFWGATPDGKDDKVDMKTQKVGIILMRPSILAQATIKIRVEFASQPNLTCGTQNQLMKYPEGSCYFSKSILSYGKLCLRDELFYASFPGQRIHFQNIFMPPKTLVGPKLYRC
jgi:hypothetical protein